MKKLAVLAISALLFTGCAGAATTQNSDPAASTTPTAAAPVDPSATPEAAKSNPAAGAAWEALMGPEGEYAALASYQAVIDKFGQVEPYVTIKKSEERHADALKRQLQRYGIEAPGNPYLGKIQAPESLKKAAEDWAKGEEANVKMYDALIKKASGDSRLVQVFTNLRRASQEQHLPMFKAAAAAGGTLTAEQMAQHQGANRGTPAANGQGRAGNTNKPGNGNGRGPNTAAPGGGRGPASTARPTSCTSPNCPR